MLVQSFNKVPEGSGEGFGEGSGTPWCRGGAGSPRIQVGSVRFWECVGAAFF